MATIAITNVTVIDGHGKRAEASRVVVEDNRIAEVSDGKSPLPHGAQVIAGSGCSVMPGMFNCHYHASYRHIGSTGLPIGMEGSPGLLTLRGAYAMGHAIDCGFTGVVSAGAPHAIDAALKQAMDEGVLRGPRMMVGSRDVSTTAHSQDMNFPWYWAPGRHPGVVCCDGPDEFRKGVRDEIKRGAQIIKIFATAGHSVRGDYERLEVSPVELAAAIEAAHERGVKVRAHLANKLGIMTSVALGLDVVDHGDGLDDECIALLAEKGAFLAPSCFYPFKSGPKRFGPDAEVMKKEMRAMLANLQKAQAAGVKIVLGDDYGTLALPHGQYGEELGFYVEQAGVSPADVIGWATRNGADLMGMRNELGDVKAGMLADLILVRGDPLDDIKLLADPANILVVMKDGDIEKDLLRGHPLRRQAPQLVGA